jgi:predicted amidohydrolase YtcJ
VAELLLQGGNIVTLEARRPRVEAVLVKGERIHYAGELREALSRASRGVERIDLKGRTLIPGFNDNHIHVLSMGDILSRPNLEGLSAGEIVERLRQVYRDARQGEILYGWGWDYPSCPAPHRELLDRAFPDNPVVLIQFSGHGMWVNSRVLEELHIDRRTPDPPGGKIVRDERGEPTGVLRDQAAMPLHRRRFMRMFTHPRLQKALLDRSLVELRKAGITSVQDNTWYPSTVGVLQGYRRAGLLSCRFTCWAYGMMPLTAWWMQLERYDAGWIRRGPWKYLLDGTFSTRTAWLGEPYAGEPENFGIQTGVREKIHRFVTASVRWRRQAAFHAIGDRTIRELLDAIEEKQKRHPWIGQLRLRIEHAQLIAPEDIPRLRRLGVLVAAQPSALGSPKKDGELLGEQRARRAYCYRWLLDEGVSLSFGSDMPGEATFDPLLGIHYAVNREGPQAISALEALQCYTLGSAYAEGMEGEKGSIVAGKLGDFAVLSADPLEVPAGRIREVQVQMTIVGGRVVYRREET